MLTSAIRRKVDYGTSVHICAAAEEAEAAAHSAVEKSRNALALTVTTVVVSWHTTGEDGRTSRIHSEADEGVKGVMWSTRPLISRNNPFNNLEKTFCRTA